MPPQRPLTQLSGRKRALHVLTINFKRLKLKPDDILVDVGCGEGRHSIGGHFFSNQLVTIGVDLKLNDLETAAQRWQESETFFKGVQPGSLLFTQANGLQLPFDTHSVDHVICSEVLEHIPDYQGIIKEMYRILKPGGSFTVSVPRAWPEKICWSLSEAYHQVEGGHIRIFNENQLHQDILQHALHFKGKHWAHALHVPYWWLRCLFWQRGENFLPTKLYHRFLIWDLMKRPALTRGLEKLLNPIMGKSVVLYYQKPRVNG